MKSPKGNSEGVEEGRRGGRCRDGMRDARGTTLNATRFGFSNKSPRARPPSRARRRLSRIVALPQPRPARPRLHAATLLLGSENCSFCLRSLLFAKAVDSVVQWCTCAAKGLQLQC